MAINSENLKSGDCYWEFYSDNYNYNYNKCIQLNIHEENPTDDEILQAIFSAGVQFGEEKAKEEMKKHLGGDKSEDSWF